MRRFLPYFVGVLTFGGVEAAFLRPIFFIPAILLILLAVACALWEIYGRIWSAKLRTLLLSQLLLIVSTFAFLLFTERMLPRHIMAVSLAGLLLFSLEQLRFLKETGRVEEPGAVSGFIILSYAATVFWASAALFGLRVFLHVPFFPLVIIMFLIVLFFNRALFANLGVVQENVAQKSFWIALLASELFVAVYASPSTLAVDGAAVAIPLALFLNLYRLKLESRLDKKTYIRNLVLGGVALALVLVTAEWK